jgi:hypothetical protein
MTWAATYGSGAKTGMTRAVKTGCVVVARGTGSGGNYLRSTYRGVSDPTYRDGDLGFRCVLASSGGLDPEKPAAPATPRAAPVSPTAASTRKSEPVGPSMPEIPQAKPPIPPSVTSAQNPTRKHFLIIEDVKFVAMDERRGDVGRDFRIGSCDVGADGRAIA